MISDHTLSFIDVARSDREHFAPGANSRQVAINGVPLETTIAATHAWGRFSSPLLDDVVNVDSSDSYLEGFLSGRSAEGLQNGRFELGYCQQCLGNDGWLFTARLDVGAKTVRWSEFGFDLENGFPRTRTGPWWRRTTVEPPADWQWWTPNPVAVELSFTFNRSNYEAVVGAERERLVRAT